MRTLDYLLEFAALRSWRCYQRVSIYSKRSLGGKPIAIPIRNGLGRSNLSPTSAELVNAIHIATSIGARGTFVDIGTNIGQSLLALLSTGADRYIGFEPDPEAAAYVAALIRRNALAEASILPIALGEVQATAVLHTGQAGWVGATMDTSTSPTEMYSFQQRVVVSTGDAQLSHLPDNEVLLLKIDVEGHELSVLRGLRKTLERTRAPVFCEVLGYDHFQDGSYGRDYFGELASAEIARLSDAREKNGVAVAAQLRQLGYELFVLGDNGVPQEIEKIDLASSCPGKQGERNVFAVPRERASKVRSLCKT